MLLTLFEHDAATWTAWGTWAYTLFTLILAIGAIGAYRSSKGQLLEAEEARRDAQRPLVVPVDVYGREEYEEEAGPTWVISIKVHNIGVGPALEVVARVWLKQAGAWLPDDRPTGSRSEGPFRCKSPHGTSSPVAIGVGDAATLPFLEGGFRLNVGVPEPLTQYVAYCVIDFSDIYGRRLRYPTGHQVAPDDDFTVADYRHVVEEVG